MDLRDERATKEEMRICNLVNFSSCFIGSVTTWKCVELMLKKTSQTQTILESCTLYLDDGDP